MCQSYCAAVLWYNRNTLEDVSHSAVLPDDWIFGTERDREIEGERGWPPLLSACWNDRAPACCWCWDLLYVCVCVCVCVYVCVWLSKCVSVVHNNKVPYTALWQPVFPTTHSSTIIWNKNKVDHVSVCVSLCGRRLGAVVFLFLSVIVCTNQLTQCV